MAEEELQVVELRDDFYRDSFGKIVFIIVSIIVAILLLIAISLVIYLNKPKPILFPVDPEWRIQASVSLEQPYILTPDLYQWVTDVLSRAFVLDFINYNDQLNKSTQYFTDDGWKIFLNQLNIYANYNNVQTNKLFVNGTPAGAPNIINQGLLSGRYAWWIEIPFKIAYSGLTPPPSQTIKLQILVVRVSTLNNLAGVAIDNVIVASNSERQATGNV